MRIVLIIQCIMLIQVEMNQKQSANKKLRYKIKTISQRQRKKQY